MIAYLDTNIVIYVVEQNPVFAPKVRNWLATARVAGDSLMISDLTRMECLVGPLKSGNAALATDFVTFFSVMNVVAITAAVCDLAARIRAMHNFKPMDALQLAAAVEHGAQRFLTADARLASFTRLTIEILSRRGEFSRRGSVHAAAGIAYTHLSVSMSTGSVQASIHSPGRVKLSPGRHYSPSLPWATSRIILPPSLRV